MKIVLNLALTSEEGLACHGNVDAWALIPNKPAGTGDSIHQMILNSCIKPTRRRSAYCIHTDIQKDRHIHTCYNICYMHTYIYMDICTHTHVHMHTHIYIPHELWKPQCQVHIPIHAYRYTHMHKYTHIYIHTQLSTYMHFVRTIWVLEVTMPRYLDIYVWNTWWGTESNKETRVFIEQEEMVQEV